MLQLHNTSHEKRKRKLVFFLTLAVLFILLGIVAPYITPNDPNLTNSAHMNEGPSRLFPFGTDQYGRCVLSRVMAGARTSIISAVLLVAITFAAGSFLGMLAGYCGGWIDAFIMRLADIFLAFPQMVLAIAVAGVLGGGMLNAMIAIGISEWTLYARLARTQVMSIKNEAYISAARLSGIRGLPLLVKYFLPNMLGPLLVQAAAQIGTTLMGIAGLSFLGIGVTEPQAEWGSMINEGRAYIQLNPWPVLAPAAAIILTVIVFNLLGDSARECLDVEA